MTNTELSPLSDAFAAQVEQKAAAEKSAADTAAVTVWKEVRSTLWAQIAESERVRLCKQRIALLHRCKDLIRRYFIPRYIIEWVEVIDGLTPLEMASFLKMDDGQLDDAILDLLSGYDHDGYRAS